MKLKTVAGINIHVSTDGAFTAVLGGQEVSRVKLADLEKEIYRHAKAIRGVWVRPFGEGHSVVNVLGIENGRFRIGERRTLLYPGSLVYRWDAEAEDGLAAIQAQHDELKADWKRLLGRMVLISEGNFGQV